MKVGVFKMPMAEYQAEHGVSQSRLKLLRQSPLHLRHAIDNPEEPTDAMILGNLEHLLVLEPSLFAKAFWSRPVTYKNDKGEEKPWHGASNVCKTWLKAHADRPVISSENEDRLLGMADAIRAHPAAAAALLEGLPEQALFCEDAETGLQIKCRADWMTGNSFVDPKTCLDASPAGFAKVVANLGYHIQAAFSLDIAKVLSLGKECFLFIAVEKDPPHAVAVYQLDEASIEYGRQEYRRLLNIYLDCVSTNQWPGYSSEIVPLSIPRWAMVA